MASFNNNHPEKRESEVFLTNIDDINFPKIKWKSKRRGNTAYNSNGNVVSGLRPVFAEWEELKEAGVDPDAIMW